MSGDVAPGFAVPSLAERFGALERQRADLFAGLAGWSVARLAYRPGPGAWSAAEVLDHLIRVEREILTATREGLAAPRRRGVRDRIGVWFIDRIFQTDRRVRAPASVPAVLPGPDANARDLGTIRDEWDGVRRGVAEFLAPLAPAQLTGGVFRHPVGGWMNVPQVLRFFWVHTYHHGFQLARLSV